MTDEPDDKAQEIARDFLAFLQHLESISPNTRITLTSNAVKDIFKKTCEKHGVQVDEKEE